MTFVNTLQGFRQNLASRFSSAEWLGAIDFSKFMIAGGSVIGSLCNLSFPDTSEQDINLFHVSSCAIDFFTDVDSTIARLKSACSVHLKDLIKVEKFRFLSRCDVTLPSGIKLCFVSAHIESSSDLMSHILHNLDIDICQIAFTGASFSSSGASYRYMCL